MIPALLLESSPPDLDPVAWVFSHLEWVAGAIVVFFLFVWPLIRGIGRVSSPQKWQARLDQLYQQGKITPAKYNELAKMVKGTQPLAISATTTEYTTTNYTSTEVTEPAEELDPEMLELQAEELSEVVTQLQSKNLPSGAQLRLATLAKELHTATVLRTQPKLFAKVLTVIEDGLDELNDQVTATSPAQPTSPPIPPQPQRIEETLPSYEAKAELTTSYQVVEGSAAQNLLAQLGAALPALAPQLTNKLQTKVEQQETLLDKGSLTGMLTTLDDAGAATSTTVRGRSAVQRLFAQPGDFRRAFLLQEILQHKDF